MTLRKAAFSAGRWTTASTLLRAAIQIAQTMFLARLLVPADFGLMAMAGTAVAVAALFSDLGLSSALIHFPLPGNRALAALYWLNLALGVLLACVLGLAAWPISWLFKTPALIPVLSILALLFPINAIGQQFRALAEKDLRFKTLAKLESTAAMTGFAAAISLAKSGAGVYALVGGSLATAASSTLLSYIYLRDATRPFTMPGTEGIGPYLLYGMHRIGEQVWNTLSQQADVFMASMYATPAALALYSTPRNQCLRIANAVVNPVVTRVGFPVMAKLQDNQRALHEVYLKTIRLTASLNFPIYALLACFPGEVIALLLGPQWTNAEFYLRIFAMWGLIRSTGNPSGSLIYAVGMVRRAHAWNFLLLVAILPLLWLAAIAGGLPALAWTMLFTQIIVFVLAWRFLIQPACGAGFIEYGAQILSPLSCTVVAGSISVVTTINVPAIWRLALGSLVFGCVYVALSIWLNRPWIRAMQELAKPVFKDSWRRRG